MPEAATPPSPTPASPPQAGGSTTPPFGSSPATSPTQNAGFQAQGVMQLGLAVKILEELVPKVGATSEVGKDVLQAITRLAKHIPPGTVTPATQQTQLQQLMLKQQQMGPAMAAMRATAPTAAAPQAKAA